MRKIRTGVVKWKTGILSGLLIFCFFFPRPCPAGQEQVYYDMGVFAFEDKAYERAENYLLKALEARPDNEYVNHYLGRVYLATGEFTKALKRLKKAYEVNPDVPGLVFELAMANFKTGAYQDAFELFETLDTGEGGDPLAVYYAGMSLFRQDQFSRALPYFLAVSGRNPSLKNSSLYYAGMCHKVLGNEEAAGQEFNFVIENEVSGNLAESAKLQLKSMDQGKTDQKPYRIQASWGYGYDDNVALSLVDNDIFTGQGDAFQEFSFSGNYDLISLDRHRLGAEFVHYQSRYETLGQYDSAGTTFGLHGVRYFDAVGLGLRFSSAFYEVDSQDYLARNTGGLRIMARTGDSFFSRFSYDYSKNDYDTNPGKDGHAHEIDADLLYSPVRGKIDLSAGVGLERNSASEPDYCFERIKTRLGLSIKAPLKIILDVKGKFEIKTYDNPDSFYGVERKDNLVSGSVTFSREVLSKCLKLSASLLYERNHSNVNSVDYRRTVSTLSLGFQF